MNLPNTSCFSDTIILPSAEAEESTVLSTLLSSYKAFQKYLPLLKPAYFYKSVNSKLFELLIRTECGDPVLLSKKSPELQDVITELTENYSPVVHLEYNIEILKKTHAQRQIIHAAQLAIGEIIKNEKSVIEITRALYQALTDTNNELPDIVWGTQYNKNGFPELKPELISGILRQSHKLLIGAPSKAGKSFLAIHLALSLASGREWLGFPCKKGPVYICNFEVDDGSYMDRVHTICKAKDWALPENIAFHHLRGYTENLESLLPAIARNMHDKGFSAIIIDPQYKLLRSSKIRDFSENNSAHMAYLYGELDRHFSRNNVSPILISHFAKGTASFKESIDRIAGSGAQMRDVDAIITLSPLDVEDSYRMEFSLREFKAPDPISLSWKYPLHIQDNLLNNIPLRRQPGRPGSPPGADDETVLTTIAKLNGNASQSRVRTELSGQIGKSRVLNTLKRLVDSGKLTTTTGGKNAIHYHVI